MNATAARTALTTVGQTVEVEVTDLTPAGFAAGMPRIWVRGTVTKVSPIGRVENGHVEVMVRTEDGGFQPRIIGKRGGGKTIRLV